MFLGQDLREEFSHTGYKLLLGKESFLLEISGGDIKKYSACQPEK